jgi:hypothetical protein
MFFELYESKQKKNDRMKKKYQKRVEIGMTLRINFIEKQRKYLNPKTYLGYILGDFQISMWYLKINPYV